MKKINAIFAVFALFALSSCGELVDVTGIGPEDGLKCDAVSLEIVATQVRDRCSLSIGDILSPDGRGMCVFDSEGNLVPADSGLQWHARDAASPHIGRIAAELVTGEVYFHDPGKISSCTNCGRVKQDGTYDPGAEMPFLKLDPRNNGCSEAAAREGVDIKR